MESRDKFESETIWCVTQNNSKDKFSTAFLEKKNLSVHKVILSV